MSATAASTKARPAPEARRCVDCGHRRIFHFEVHDNRANHFVRIAEQPVSCSIPNCRCATYHATELDPVGALD